MHPDPNIEEGINNSVEKRAFDREKEKRRNPATEEIAVERWMERAELEIIWICN